MSQAALDAVKKIQADKPLDLSIMTLEEKIVLIEAFDFVVSRFKPSALSEFYCVWDPHDFNDGWCVRGEANVLDESIKMIESLKG